MFSFATFCEIFFNNQDLQNEWKSMGGLRPYLDGLRSAEPFDGFPSKMLSRHCYSVLVRENGKWESFVILFIYLFIY